MLENNFQKPEVGYWKYQNQVRVEKQILNYVHVCRLPSEVLYIYIVNNILLVYKVRFNTVQIAHTFLPRIFP